MINADSSLDIILPCYNPPNGWASDIIQMDAALKSDLKNINIHWIIVNDGSIIDLDSAVKTLENSDLSMDFIDNEFNRGKGYALRCGCEKTTAEYIIYTDIDLPYDYSSFMNIFKAITQEDSDVAIGVRDNSYFKNIPRQRRIISKIVRFLNKKLMRLAHADTQCGLKGFNKNGRAIFLSTKTDRYLIDLEFIKYASRAKTIKISAIPVSLRSDIVLPEIGGNVLRKELLNYIRILFS